MRNLVECVKFWAPVAVAFLPVVLLYVFPEASILIKDGLLVFSLFLVSITIWTAPVQGVLKKCKRPAAIIIFFICSAIACSAVERAATPENPPRLHLLYDAKSECFYVYNDDPKDYLQLWGTRLSTEQPVIEQTHRLISPNGGSYFLRANAVVKEILEKRKENFQVPFELFLESARGEKYQASFILMIHVQNHMVFIDTQMTSLSRDEWEITS